MAPAVAAPLVAVAALLFVPTAVSAAVPVASSAVAAVRPVLAGGCSPVTVPLGVVATVAAVAGTVLAGTTMDRAFDQRGFVEGGLDAGGDADPAVLSLVAEPYATVEGAHRRLLVLERLFRERNDRRAVFITVFARVTGEVAAGIERGAFEDPAWVADYLVRFADLYRQAVCDFETGQPTGCRWPGG